MIPSAPPPRVTAPESCPLSTKACIAWSIFGFFGYRTVSGDSIGGVWVQLELVMAMIPARNKVRTLFKRTSGRPWRYEHHNLSGDGQEYLASGGRYSERGL